MKQVANSDKATGQLQHAGRQKQGWNPLLPDAEVLRKNLCKFDNSDKKRYCERLEKQPLNFFTVYNTYRNLSSFSNSQSAEMERSGMEAD